MVLGIELSLLARIVLVYVLGIAMLVVGVQHAVYAWTGQTEKLTPVFEGLLEERLQTRRWLWAIGGQVVALAGLALIGVVTWLLLT